MVSRPHTALGRRAAVWAGVDHGHNIGKDGRPPPYDIWDVLRGLFISERWQEPPQRGARSTHGSGRVASGASSERWQEPPQRGAPSTHGSRRWRLVPLLNDGRSRRSVGNPAHMAPAGGVWCLFWTMAGAAAAWSTQHTRLRAGRWRLVPLLNDGRSRRSVGHPAYLHTWLRAVASGASTDREVLI